MDAVAPEAVTPEVATQDAIAEIPILDFLDNIILKKIPGNFPEYCYIGLI